MTGVCDGLILRVINTARVVGRFEERARLEPDAASGLKRCAAKHRADYRLALDEWMGGLGLMPGPLSYEPRTKKGGGEFGC